MTFFVVHLIYKDHFVEGKSLKTNPRYFFNGRFLKKGKVWRLLVFTIEVTCKGLKGFSLIL
jgi:hypothetical protein